MAEEDLTMDAENEEAASEEVETEEESKEDRTEQKRTKFRAVGVRRTNAVLDSIRLLRQLSNTSSYSYSDEEVDKMFSAIQESLDSARESFAQSKRWRRLTSPSIDSPILTNKKRDAAAFAVSLFCLTHYSDNGIIAQKLETKGERCFDTKKPGHRPDVFQPLSSRSDRPRGASVSFQQGLFHA